MKICFNQATTMKYSTLEKDLIYCEKYGYDLIEIRIDKLRDYLTRHSVADLKEFFKKNNLKPYAFNALEFITFQKEDAFKKHIDTLHEIGQIGQAIGCSKTVVVPTFNVLNKTTEEIKNESVHVLKTLADIGSIYNMKLAFEFVGYPHCSVNTFEQTYEIIKAVDCKNVGLVLDCFHFHAMNSKFDKLEELDPEKLFIFHIDDSEGLPVGSLRDHNRLWPGDGVIDLHRILSVLKRIGYDEMVSVELFRPEYWNMDIEKVIEIGKKKTIEVIKPYFA